MLLKWKVFLGVLIVLKWYLYHKEIKHVCFVVYIFRSFITFAKIQKRKDKYYIAKNMFLALHPMESISLNLFVLLEHLALLLTSTLAINCKLRNFLNKAISIINFAKPFLNNFIDDTMI